MASRVPGPGGHASLDRAPLCVCYVSRVPATATKTETQVSAGGVTFRTAENGIVEVVLISVGEPGRSRWQLPKGRIDGGETKEATAVREVREETGIDAELLGVLGTVDYWYWDRHRAERTRLHKFVHFFLLSAVGGDVTQHDREALEARWFPIDEAERVLAFESERKLVRKARELIDQVRSAS